ncbi:MAG: polysaccharide pyruvyl transferase family protein [Planctomycetota bacterium]|nr:polysaccharide pyruvyl transferase family protein [Planctomycetota bacterium]
MKILVADVWSVYNAGDRAILEGLLDGLRAQYPGASIAVCAHFPDGCAGIAGIEVIPDVLAFDEAAWRAQLAHLDGSDARIDAVKSAYQGADLVVSTGGYFLNATPGNAFALVFLSRLLHYGWALDAGVPVAVLGQSIGPIEGAALQAAARATFARIPVIGARDAASFAYLQRTGLATHAVFTGDFAADLVPASDSEVAACMRRLDLPRGALGISVRDYPGTPAQAFRDVARVADRCIRELGVPVLLIGTTIPPEDAPEVRRRERSLGNDDSIALLDVYSRMEEKARARVCIESLPPRLLKGVLATCRAFLGTRMHASILASTSGVPAAGIAYEYKVRGWFERLGLHDLVIPLEALSEATVWPVVERLLRDGDSISAQLVRAIPHVQAKTRENFRLLAGLVPATGKVPDASSAAPRAQRSVPPLPTAIPTAPRPSTATPTATAPAPTAARRSSSATSSAASASATAVLPSGDPRAAWEKESHHYDVLHRRLRTIVDLAEAAGGRRLLDVGCSAGTVGAALSAGWAYHGCDVSESAVRSASRGWLVAADLEKGIPAFDGGAYDVIVCSGILEYLEAPGNTLRELTQRIAPTGKLVVSYFNMRHVSRRGGSAFRHPLWRNDYAPAEFRDLLASAGWAIEATRWSTAGPGTAPDVRDEAAAVRDEPADAAARIDDIGHTLIYVCSPDRETARRG